MPANVQNVFDGFTDIVNMKIVDPSKLFEIASPVLPKRF
jgi:hypothetical protein